MNWATVELGEVCRPKQHKTIPSKELLDEGYVVYGANGPIGYYSDFTHDRTTIAVTCRGATCGTINVVPPMSYITGNAMALDNLDEKRINLSFLRYALEHQGFDSVINGAAQPQITRGPLLSYKIPLPPLEEQKRIAGILDQADTLRRLRSRALDKLNTLGQAIFHEMFGDPVANPKNWPVVSVGEIGQVQGGLQVSKKRDAFEMRRPYLRVANVYRDSLDLDEMKEIGLTESEFNRVLLRPGDVLIVEGHGNPSEIGRTAVWNGELANCVHQNHLIRFRADKNAVLPQYFSSLMNSERGRTKLTSSSRTTSGLNTISTKKVKDATIPLPPIPQQQKFVELMLAAAIEVNKQADARVQSSALFRSLQHRAFRGEL